MVFQPLAYYDERELDAMRAILLEGRSANHDTCYEGELP